MAEDVAKSQNNWFDALIEKSAKSDVLKKSDRFGQVAGIIGVVIVSIFFAYHLALPTGFFTSSFGAIGAFFFFVPAIYGMVPQFIRLYTGRKSLARQFDIFGMTLVLIAVIYFLATFPFDFSHLADPLPRSIEWILSWISDDLVKALMVLGVIGMLVAIPIQTIIWKYAKNIPAEPTQKAEEPPPAPGVEKTEQK